MCLGICRFVVTILLWCDFHTNSVLIKITDTSALGLRPAPQRLFFPCFRSPCAQKVPRNTGPRLPLLAVLKWVGQGRSWMILVALGVGLLRPCSLLAFFKKMCCNGTVTFPTQVLESFPGFGGIFSYPGASLQLQPPLLQLSLLRCTAMLAELRGAYAEPEFHREHRGRYGPRISATTSILPTRVAWCCRHMRAMGKLLSNKFVTQAIVDWCRFCSGQHGMGYSKWPKFSHLEIHIHSRQSTIT